MKYINFLSYVQRHACLQSDHLFIKFYNVPNFDLRSRFNYKNVNLLIISLDPYPQSSIMNTNNITQQKCVTLHVFFVNFGIIHFLNYYQLNWTRYTAFPGITMTVRGTFGAPCVTVTILTT